MFFIRGMVTGKWICFYAVRKVTDNGHVLGEGWTLVVQNFKIKNRCQIEILKKQLTTKAQLLPNTCYVRLWVLKTDFIM